MITRKLTTKNTKGTKFPPSIPFVPFVSFVVKRPTSFRQSSRQGTSDP
jgi:hypothetical protein